MQPALSHSSSSTENTQISQYVNEHHYVSVLFSSCYAVQTYIQNTEFTDTRIHFLTHTHKHTLGIYVTMITRLTNNKHFIQKCHKRKCRHTHLDYACSAVVLYCVVGMASAGVAHRSVDTDKNVFPWAPEQEYYTKPQKIQTCQHLPQESHKQAQTLNKQLINMIILQNHSNSK